MPRKKNNVEDNTEVELPVEDKIEPVIESPAVEEAPAPVEEVPVKVEAAPVAKVKPKVTFVQ
jgi:hypothetical protein